MINACQNILVRRSAVRSVMRAPVAVAVGRAVALRGRDETLVTLHRHTDEKITVNWVKSV